MRHVILATGLIVLCVGSLTAAPVFPSTQCDATPGAVVITPSDILFFNPTWTAPGFQCEQSDMLFSDFTTTGNTFGVTMRLTLQGNVHTINFAGNLSNPFTISFTATMDPTSVERIFAATADLSNPGHIGNPSVTKSVVELAPGVFTGSTTASFLGGSGAPIHINPFANSLRVTDAYTPNGGSATGFANALFPTMNSLPTGGPQSLVPEPPTTTLFGTGLLLALALGVRLRTI